MTQPTQELPPWLSASPTVITDPAGEVITTTTVVQLPLTYYGPSIPLGTDGVWVWGGSTSPPPTPSSSSPPLVSPATTAIPTTPPPTTAIPTTTSPSSSSRHPSQSSSSTSAPTAFPFSSNSLALSRGAKVGIIIGSILGSTLLLLFLLLFLRWRTRRRGSDYHTPIWTGWEIVPTSLTGRDRLLGEGSPRHSGDEDDSFLKSPTGDKEKDMMLSFPIVAPRLISKPNVGDAEAATANLAGVTADHSSHTSSSHTHRGRFPSTSSGYGTLVDHSTIGIVPGGTLFADVEHESPQESHPPSTIGHHRSSSFVRTMTEAIERRISAIRGRSSGSKTNGSKSSNSRNGSHSGSGNGSPVLRHVTSSVPEGYSPLIPPPTIDPDRLPAPPGPRRQSSYETLSNTQTQRSSAEVLTAMRVRAEDLGPRTASSSPVTVRDRAPSSTRTGPLSGLPRLSRFSWFRPQDASSSRRQSAIESVPPSSFPANLFPEPDLENGHTTPSSRELGLNPDGSRPLSSVSARSGASGNTIYHDAFDDFEQPPPVPPLPRAYMTRGGGNGTQGSSGQYQPLPSVEPQDPEPQSAPQNNEPNSPAQADVLDTPAPRPASPFSASSNSSTRPRYPPGLGLPMPSAWRESMGWSSGDGAVSDVLEDLPPSAGEGWRTLASSLQETLNTEAGWRSTFGMPTIIHPQEVTMSEMGSLHSNRSRLSPHSGRSTGSVPASSRRAFSSLSSSFRSPRSQGRSASSGASASHAGSVTSDGRRRLGQGAISPATSALGRGNEGSSYLRARIADTTSDTIVPGVIGVPISPRRADRSAQANTPERWIDMDDGPGVRLVTSMHNQIADQDVVE